MTDPVNFLLVDDLDENLLSLAALLQRDGLACLKARSGDEALELLLQHDVALALLDVQMPGMDGFELAEFMRGNERARHIPIIFLTAGNTDRQRRFRGYEAGAVDFIQKPIEADILRSKAGVFFDLYRQRQQILAQRDALEANAEALRAVDQRKNEFIAVLGHELRNPLMALSGGLELLHRHKDPAKAEQIRGMMERQVFHLSRLIEDLLDVSRIGQGKILLKKEEVELGAILRSAIEVSQPHIDARRHTLVVEAETEPLLYADPTRLAQVVSNLLNNAAKYTPSGGRITLTAKALPGWVEIAVSDNGVGIAADMQAKIFEIFAQVRDEATTAHDGLGIGLALVKQLVELHSGDISVESPGPGQGSTFSVRLPLADAEPGAEPDAAGCASASARAAAPIGHRA
ncbi:MAG TPA: hybrid sensor histidine kinase/response regulator [Caulobacteraceae bacterium]|jgi:signal transduction histidine kinase|nr:hybrid sensor histidine kinase/response regulator [Caulobacteraceae bacterium]